MLPVNYTRIKLECHLFFFIYISLCFFVFFVRAVKAHIMTLFYYLNNFILIFPLYSFKTVTSSLLFRFRIKIETEKTDGRSSIDGSGFQITSNRGVDTFHGYILDFCINFYPSICPVVFRRTCRYKRFCIYTKTDITIIKTFGVGKSLESSEILCPIDLVTGKGFERSGEDRGVGDSNIFHLS